MQDGKFELLLVRTPKKSGGGQRMPSGAAKQEVQLRYDYLYQRKKAEITADPQMPWTLDGERNGHREVEVENLHHAISLIKKIICSTQLCAISPAGMKF